MLRKATVFTNPIGSLESLLVIFYLETKTFLQIKQQELILSLMVTICEDDQDYLANSVQQRSRTDSTWGRQVAQSVERRTLEAEVRGFETRAGHLVVGSDST